VAGKGSPVGNSIPEAEGQDHVCLAAEMMNGGMIDLQICRIGSGLAEVVLLISLDTTWNV